MENKKGLTALNCEHEKVSNPLRIIKHLFGYLGEHLTLGASSAVGFCILTSLFGNSGWKVQTDHFFLLCTRILSGENKPI